MLAAAICQLVLATGDLTCTEPMPAHLVERMMPSPYVLDAWRGQPDRFRNEGLGRLSPPFIVYPSDREWRAVVEQWESQQ